MNAGKDVNMLDHHDKVIGAARATPVISSCQGCSRERCCMHLIHVQKSFPLT